MVRDFRGQWIRSIPLVEVATCLNRIIPFTTTANIRLGRGKRALTGRPGRKSPAGGDGCG